MRNIFLFTMVVFTIFLGCKKIDKRQTYLQGTWVLNKFLVNGNDSTLVQKSKKNYADYFITYNDWAKQHTESSGWVVHANEANSKYYYSLYPSSDFKNIYFLDFNFNLKNDSTGLRWDINSLSNDEFVIECNVNGFNYKSYYGRN